MRSTRVLNILVCCAVLEMSLLIWPRTLYHCRAWKLRLPSLRTVLRSQPDDWTAALRSKRPASFAALSLPLTTPNGSVMKMKPVLVRYAQRITVRATVAKETGPISARLSRSGVPLACEADMDGNMNAWIGGDWSAVPVTFGQPD